MNPILNGRIDPSNFEIFARAAYINSMADEEEFVEDLRRTRYIKKAMSKYRETGEIRPLLILNHLRVWFNVFTPSEAAIKILVFRLSRDLEQLKPFLIFLNRWPDKIDGLGYADESIWGSDVPMDMNIVSMLREIPTRGTIDADLTS